MAKKFYKEDDLEGYAIKYADAKPNGFSEITDQDELSILYLKHNNKLKEDGKEYTANFKVVRFGMNYRDGILSDSNVDYLYTKLTQVILRLEDGNWDSTLYFMNNHLNIITQEDIDNGYTQEVNDNIINDINEYLNQ